MTSKDVWNYLKDYFTKFFIVCFVLAIVCGIIHKCDRQDKQNSPVEENKIDSLKVENTKIVSTIDSLEDIKNAKIIEVKSLDNDSTLMLFYELLRK